MQFDQLVKNIRTKEDFINFIDKLLNDINKNQGEWQNKSIDDYLASISSWVDDMDGYFSNTGEDKPENINWQFIATLLYIGKIYE